MQKDSSTVRVEKSCKYYCLFHSQQSVDFTLTTIPARMKFLAVRVCSVFIYLFLHILRFICFYFTLYIPGESMLTSISLTPFSYNNPANSLISSWLRRRYALRPVRYFSVTSRHSFIFSCRSFRMSRTTSQSVIKHPFSK